MRGGMYRGQPFQGDLEKCHKQKEIMDLSDLATSHRQPNAAQVTVRSDLEWRSKYFHLAMRRGGKTAKVAMAGKSGGLGTL